MRSLVVAVVVVACPAVARAQLWDDATADTIGTTAEWTNKVELGDVDGDGWVDILFANGGNYSTAGTPEPQRLFRNLGNWDAAPPHFEERAGAPTLLSRVTKLRDVDGDGDQDLFLGGAHGTASQLVLQTDVGGVPASIPGDALYLGDAEFGDVDGDGDLDLLLADWGGVPTQVAGGQTRLWLNDGAGAFTDATDRVPADLVGMSWDLELADVDDDRDLDILVSCKLCAGGRLYVNDGAGTFTDESTARLPQAENNYEYEPMDIDGDGDLDLVTINDGPQLRETVLVNDGAGHFADETATRLPGAANTGDDDNVATFLDVDADGDADVLIGSLDGADRLWRNDGGGVFALDDTVITLATPGTLGLAVADLDRDGRLDVVQGQGEVASPDKVLLANTGVAVDVAPPAIRLVHAAEEGDLEVVARIHDRKSPSLAHDWQRVDLEVVSGGTRDPIPMRWRGEYLWTAEVPAGDPDVRYRVCAADARGNELCTPPVGLGENLPDAGVGPDAAGPAGDAGGGGCCDAGGGAPASAWVLALLVAVGLRQRGAHHGSRRREA